MTNQIEEHALVNGRLHPKVREFLQPYFPDIDLYDVRVNAKLGRTSALGTSIWVFGKTIYVMRGKFNAKHEAWTTTGPKGQTFYYNNSAIDLATTTGMRILAHEVYHCQSWLTRPWWASVGEWVGDFFRSVWGTRFRSGWSHDHSHLEQAAIQAVDNGPIGRAINDRATELKAFEALR